MQISLDDIKRARETRDPFLPGMCITLAGSDQPRKTSSGETEEDKALFHYFQTIDSPEFAALPEREKARFRVEQFQRIEEEKAVKTPERFLLYPLILELWKTRDLYSRHCLKEIIARAPLGYGIWKALKIIYKEAEERKDTEIYGALSARFDMELAANRYNREVRRGTIIYLVRRSWRFLRNLGTNYSSLYCRSAIDILKAYTDSTRWSGTWIANHIFQHKTGHYGNKRFRTGFNRNDMLRGRAFGALWQEDPGPLLELLEEARSSLIREYAVMALKKDHRIALREISPTTVLGLLKAEKKEIDAFCVWLFDSVPRFEQTRLREQGLHEAVIRLLKSQSPQALQFAAGYVRVHAKDLPLDQVLELVNHEHKEVRELAVALLGERDPRKEIGLDAWARLLGTPYGNTLGENAIIKHFSPGELTPAWFGGQLLRERSHNFAATRLLKIHDLKTLGPAYFISLFRHADLRPFCVPFLLEQLRKFPAEELDREFLKEALFSFLTRDTLIQWVQTGYCDTGVFGVDYLLALAVEPEWKKDPWIQDKIAGDKEGQRYPGEFDENLSTLILDWLKDVRKFQPRQIGHARLMELVKSKEERYHNYALQYMTKAFTPADFAPEEAAAESPAAREINIDLEGQSFLFTGKLKTMTRSEAREKVLAANGKNGSGVNKKLDYLVIGDEGSPFYGAGKKGSKQLAAEALMEEGVPVKIISETAFLQLLAGHHLQADTGSTLEGCEKLWEYVIKKGSEENPLRLFAVHYIRHHHQDIGPGLMDRPVDPGSEVPHSFFSFQRLLPLFREKRQSLVTFALELARWEAAEWVPPFQQILELCETGHLQVKEFIARALKAGPEKEHRRYRLTRDLIVPENIYRLCESPETFARNLGMELLDLYPRLADPAALFRLTESADRKIRYFAVEMIWRRYRNRGLSPGWTPPPEKGEETSPAEERKETPDPWLGGEKDMREFLRRMLFEIPPGRDKGKRKGMKTLASGKAKIALVETYRNMALGEEKFAAMVIPVLGEFMASRGLMEERACLAALARITRKYPEIDEAKSWLESRKESMGL